MSPQSQPRVPGLEIVDLIGEGGQASVYRAHQPSHDRLVAVRVIRAPWIDDDGEPTPACGMPTPSPPPGDTAPTLGSEAIAASEPVHVSPT